MILNEFRIFSKNLIQHDPSTFTQMYQYGECATFTQMHHFGECTGGADDVVIKPKSNCVLKFKLGLPMSYGEIYRARRYIIEYGVHNNQRYISRIYYKSKNWKEYSERCKEIHESELMLCELNKLRKAPRVETTDLQSYIDTHKITENFQSLMNITNHEDETCKITFKLYYKFYDYWVERSIEKDCEVKTLGCDEYSFEMKVDPEDFIYNERYMDIAMFNSAVIFVNGECARIVQFVGEAISKTIGVTLSYHMTLQNGD